jgi:hypothetical protein
MKTWNKIAQTEFETMDQQEQADWKDLFDRVSARS